MRPAAFIPRSAAGNTLRCGEEGCDGKGRLEIGVDEGEGEGQEEEEEEERGERRTAPRPPREVLEPYDPPYDPASQSLLSLSLPYTPPLAPLVARILSLGPLRHSSCFPDPFPSGPREGVVGVLSEGWRCQAPVAARTLSLGFLSFSRFVFSVPPSLRYRSRSLSFSRSRSVDRDREILPMRVTSFPFFP